MDRVFDITVSELSYAMTTQDQVYFPEGIYYRRFTLIIPAYNEEKRIKPVLNEICAYIESNNYPWNVIISIDGNDGTEDIVRSMEDEFPFLSFTKGTGRNGKGGAIKRAVNIASGEFVMLMDADGSVSFHNLITSMNFLNFYDVVTFDRYSSNQNEIPFLRRVFSRGFNKLVRGIIGIRINDTQCGYKIMRTSYAVEAFEKISVSNTFFDVALFYYMKKDGAKSVEIPVSYRHGEESKFNVIGEVLGQGTSLIAFRLRNSPLWKYVPRKLVDLYYRKFRWI